MPTAAYGYLGVGVETTHGVEVAPTKFIPVKSVNFDVQQDEIMWREIVGSRQAQQSFSGTIRPSVTFDTAFYAEGPFGVLFKALFGQSTSAAAGASITAFTHTFADQAPLPSLSFERADSRTGTGLLHQRIGGCKIESISVSAEFGAEVNLSVTAQGLNFPSDPAAKPATFPLPIANPFIFTGVSIDIDGVPNDLFKSISFDFNNTLEPQESLRQVATAYKIHEGPMECTLSGDIIFENASLYEKFRDRGEFTMAVTFTGDIADSATSTRYKTVFTWTKVRVNNFDVTMEAEGVMEASVEFIISYDKTLGRLVRLVMTNLDNATAYNT